MVTFKHALNALAKFLAVPLLILGIVSWRFGANDDSKSVDF